MKNKQVSSEIPILIPSTIIETEDEPYPSWASHGRDEMNLAEFPFASLRRHGDSRKAIVYEGWVTDKNGNRLRQKWTVQGGSLVGLPTEFDERVYVALMAIATHQGFESRKTRFSIYQVLRVIGVADTKLYYQAVESSLDRLTGVTVKTEGAFWDNEKKALVTTKAGFHILDKYWLRIREQDERVIEAEGVPAYILWSEDIWKSIRSGYIKSLDIRFYYSLKNPIARRLYRLLDKRFWNKSNYEFDVFDLAGKLGMARYRKPSDVMAKLQPALDELLTRGFLARAESLKSHGYSRIKFTKSATAPTSTLATSKEKRHSESAPQGHPEQVPPLVSSLVGIGMTTKTAQQLVKTYAVEQIQNWMDAAKWEREQGKGIKNIAAYVRRALEEGWTLPTGFKTQAQLVEEEAQRAERIRQTNALLEAQEEKERIQRQEKDQAQQALLETLQAQYHTTAEERESWKKALAYIESVDADVYKFSFANTYLLAFREGKAVIGVLQPLHPRQAKKMQDYVYLALKDQNYQAIQIAFEVLPSQMP